MPCPTEDQIVALIEQRLDSTVLAAFHEHVDQCPLCQPLITELARASDEASLPVQCETVSKYVLQGLLGQGGMGVVYAAHDPDLNRPVAIKLLHTESEHAAAPLRQRLLREAQAMARLSHPNVVSVYEVGLSGDQVFIAMELVDGRTLRRWLAEDSADWRTIIAAYRQAGQALAAAHAVGIVHRDFKPDNVLIDRNGRVRVADFGLARASTDGEESQTERKSDAVASTAAAGKLTRTGSLIGTPAYMAPEQHLGKAADAAADQFSFCVSLYEALWQQPPFAGQTLAELAHSVIGGQLREPPRSARVPIWVYRVLAKGLHANLRDRYSSMDAILAALDRDPARVRRKWLAGASLFALVAAAVAGVVRPPRAAICGGAAQKLVGVWDANRRRIVHDAFVATGKPFAEASFATIASTLDSYLAGWSAMYGEACTATRVRGEQSEEVMELRMECLDRRHEEVHALVNLFAEADARVVERAVDAVQRLPSLDECRNADALRQVVRPPAGAEAHARVATLRAQLAQTEARINAGQTAEARKLVAAAVAEAQALGYAPVIAEALYVRGQTEHRGGDFQGAADTLLVAATTAEAGRYDHERARAQSLRMYVLCAVGRYAEAHEDYALGRAALARAGGDPLIEATFDSHETLVLTDEGRYDEALALQERVLARLQQLPGANDQRLIGAHLSMGNLRAHRGDFDQAVASYKRALALAERTYGAGHLMTAISWDGIADAWFDKGDLRSTIMAYEKLLAIREAALGPHHFGVAATLAKLAVTLIRARQFDRALPLLERARAILLPMGPDNASVAYVELGFAELFLHKGKLDVALAHAQRSLALRERAYDAKHLYVGEALTSLGRIRVARHEDDEALEPLERAIAILEHYVAQSRLGLARFALARALWNTGRDRLRARALALAARDHVAEDRAEIEDWLAKHR
jgi:tetratricopeptide (TPR) repeat protein